MIEILTRDTAETSYFLCVMFERGGAVDEQVATFALEQEGTDLERGSEPQRLGHRGVETRDHVIHQTHSSSGLLDAPYGGMREGSMHRARGRFSAWTFVQASPASTPEMGAVDQNRLSRVLRFPYTILTPRWRWPSNSMLSSRAKPHQSG